jgi:hypothetical protein
VKNWKKCQFENLSQLIQNNPQLLWKEVTKLMRSTSTLTNQITNTEWHTHFSSIYACDPPPIDTDFHEILQKQFSKLNPPKNYIIITHSMLLTHIRLLQIGKAPGVDGLQVEHLKYGTHVLFEHLALLFQIILSQQYVPKTLCEGLVTCVSKKNKDPALCNSYRPITICSVLSKLLEKIICPFLREKCDFVDHQFGFRQDLGVQNAHSLLLSIMERHKIMKESLYVCTVDIAEAFDSILHSQSLVALLNSRTSGFISRAFGIGTRIQ